MRTSHQKCERCHVRQAHKRAKYNMCPPCRREYRAELEEKRAARNRRIDPVMDAVLDVEIERKEPREMLNDLTHMWTGSPVPKVRPQVVMRRVDPVTVGRVGRPPLSDEKKLEIGRMYEEGLTYEQINKQASVNNGTIAQVVRELGLPSRKRGPQPRASEPTPSPDQGEIIGLTMPAEYYNQPGDPPGDKDPPLPEPQRKAIERMVLPPKPEPRLHSTRPPVSDVDAVHWQVRVEGILDAYYPTIEEALASVRRLQPGLRITGIVQAQ